MENVNPILRYLSRVYREQTPVMASTNACMSRLAIITQDPLQFEVEVTIDADQLRTYAIQKLSTESIAPPLSGCTGASGGNGIFLETIRVGLILHGYW